MSIFASIESNLKNKNEIGRAEVRDSKGLVREGKQAREDRGPNAKKENWLKAGKGLTCLKRTNSALRLCSLY